ncbi:hypothetical protein GCM10009527_071960 [Actinomadura nitritigenes]|uniref:Gram-positive cocci surface proteins LPxTG domain-containing protein n=1 Tax=Actinomadura nitritigenes TaxID=134602 RepID=A0ABS3R525_9ACTN|nr:hypothetical protein [Actinomadura nitritigenes]MBO2441356.1 hypothetical protein [Actinomadura nitritigenes]
MLISGSVVHAFIALLALTPLDPTPTPTTTAPTTPATTPGTPSPTTPEPTTPTPTARVAITPSTVPAGGAQVTVTAFCPQGTAKATVGSNAFGRHPLNGTGRLTVQTLAAARPDRYAVNLRCEGTTISAQTSLLITQASPAPTPSGPTPSGPPQTGGGATSAANPLLTGGVALIGLGAVAGVLALRRRREGGE